LSYQTEELLLFLKVKGFFDDISDEMTGAFEDKNFVEKFFRYIEKEKPNLKEALLVEMKKNPLIHNISNDLKKEFSDTINAFMKTFTKEE
jgi:hypothetical protein